MLFIAKRGVQFGCAFIAIDRPTWKQARSHFRSLNLAPTSTSRAQTASNGRLNSEARQNHYARKPERPQSLQVGTIFHCCQAVGGAHLVGPACAPVGQPADGPDLGHCRQVCALRNGKCEPSFTRLLRRPLAGLPAIRRVIKRLMQQALARHARK